jgi:NADH-quinone oxidoreductase subunit A
VVCSRDGLGNDHASDIKSDTGEERGRGMSALTLLFVLIALVGGLAVLAYGVVLAVRGRREVAMGRQPSWVRFHVRYYTFALLFIAFDMEMAYMYPWAVVFRSLGWFAYAEIGFFLTVLGLGIVYAWREGALEWS